MKKITPQEIQKKAIMSGFDYFYPQESKLVEYMEKIFKQTAEVFGFEKIEGPILQPIEFYEIKSGEELLKNTYRFQDENKNLLVLRPEFTPTIAYMIAKESPKLSFPIKWWSNPVLFRKERPQKGRKRQFKQLNMDIFDRADSGRQRYFDEAEIIAVASFIFKSFGLSPKDIVIKINSRNLTEKLFEYLQIDKEDRINLNKLLDKYGKINDKEFNLQLKKILKENKEKIFNIWLKIRSLREVANLKDFSFITETIEYQNLLKVFELLESYQAAEFCEFDPTIVRGLGYYTGTVFEAFEKDSENGLKRAILGGGRYDNLTKEMGGKIEITGVGFGFGNTPFEELLKAKRLILTKDKINYYICCQTKELFNNALKIASILREKGKSVLIDSSLAKENPENISKQLSRANTSNSRFSIILFPKEWKKEQIVIKNMQDQTQQTIDVKSLF